MSTSTRIRVGLLGFCSLVLLGASPCSPNYEMSRNCSDLSLTVEAGGPGVLVPDCLGTGLMEVTYEEQISFTSVPFDLRAVIVPGRRSNTIQISAIFTAMPGTKEMVRIHTEPRGRGLHQFAHDYRVSVTIAPNSGPRYQIGGNVSGLNELFGSLELQDANAGKLTVTGDGPFSFPTPLPTGVGYSATVTASPPGQTCTIATGSGTVAAADVTSIAVTCVNLMVPHYAVGGVVHGLVGTLVLQDKNADDLPITGDGRPDLAFAFHTALPSGATYSASVAAAPPDQYCTISNEGGTVAAADVTNISVTCVNRVVQYTIGGRVDGLTGTLVLQDNGGDDLPITGDGPFVFHTPLPTGAPYSAMVTAAPPGQDCTISNESGTVAAANVTNIAVTCVNLVPHYTISGKVEGLVGTGLVLVLVADNVSYEVPLDGPASFTFSAELVEGTHYQVSVSHQPTVQTCTVKNGSGNVSKASVTDVLVSCFVDFTVSVGANPLVTSTGGSTTLSAIVSGGIGPFNYAWRGYRDDGSPFSYTLSSSTAAQPTAALVFPGSDFYFFVTVTDTDPGGSPTPHDAYVRVHEADDVVARFTVSPDPNIAGAFHFDATASTGVVTPVGWTIQYLGNVARPSDIEGWLTLQASSNGTLFWTTLFFETSDLLTETVPNQKFPGPLALGAYRMLLEENGDISTHQTYEYFYVAP